MPISFKFRDDLPVSDCLEFPVEWVVLCDYCGLPITPDDPGNVELTEAGKPLLFLHKACSDVYAQEHGKPALWNDLIRVRIETK